MTGWDFSTFQQSLPTDIHWWGASCGASTLRVEIYRTLRDHQEPTTTPTSGCLWAVPSSCQSKCSTQLLPLLFFPSSQWKQTNAAAASEWSYSRSKKNCTLYFILKHESSALIMCVGAKDEIPPRQYYSSQITCIVPHAKKRYHQQRLSLSPNEKPHTLIV